MYQNVIFDFGNVIGKFCHEDVLDRCCPECSEQEREELTKAMFHNWSILDTGTVEYEDYFQETLQMLPENLHAAAEAIFRDWYRLPYVPGIPELIADLKKQGRSLYLLSNAPCYFSEKSGYFQEVLQFFDGIIFSADIKMVKPHPEIYQYLLKKFSLNPKDCLFIDDLPQNIAGAKQCGIDGFLFTGDVDALRKKLS